jgi:hypothetical protein
MATATATATATGSSRHLLEHSLGCAEVIRISVGFAIPTHPGT